MKNLFFGYLVNSVYFKTTFILVFLVAFSGCRSIDPIKDETGQIVPGALIETAIIEVNGVQQLLSIRGANSELPVLLFVHGGLGTPYSALSHTFQREWEKKFVVVQWEQRGSGKLFDLADPHTITTQQLLEDTKAIASYLKTRFGGKRIFLISHSWGSYLAYRTAAANPELFQAYIGVGQTVGLLKEDLISHDWVLQEAKKRNDLDALNEMKEIGQPPYTDVIKAYDIKYSLVAKYGGFLQGKEGMGFMFKSILTSPEYSLLDAVHFVRGMSKYQNALLTNDRAIMWNLAIDDIKEIKIPVYFIFGENDQATPPFVTEEYASHLKAQNKSIVRIPEAAHFPFIDQPQAFTKILFKILDQNQIK